MKKIGNVLWGIVFILIGCIFGLNALGYTDINIFFDGWWTLFIIIPCFIGLFKEREKTGNLIGLVVGVVLLLSAQGILDFNIVWKLLFPAILVAIGISFLFKDVIHSKINKEIKRLNKNQSDDNEYCAIFGAQDVKFDDQEFKGADLTAVFGAVNCDLRRAKITSDQVINSTAIFGGVEIYVPSDVKVKIKSTPIFGGVSDKTVQIIKEDAPTLYINSTSIFGGVDIK